MRSIELPLAALLVLVVSGCPSQRTPRPSEQASLDHVAQCFHDSVTLLQREPESPDQFAALIREADAQLGASNDTALRGAFSRLRWDDSGKRLITPSGAEIQCRIQGEQEDLYDDGSSLFATYEFFVPRTELRATTAIELSMRQ
jgi:hypothetical protein